MDKKKIIRNIKNEYAGRSFAIICGLLIVVLTISIIIFISSKGLSIFYKYHYSIGDILFSTKWNPEAAKPSFGSLIFIIGSTLFS